jgi:hypothetical protein
VDEKKFVNNADVDIVTEPTHFDVVGERIFTVSETDEKLETREEVMKDNFTDAAVTQALKEEIKSAQDLIANFNHVSDSIESPQKFFAVTSTPSPEKTVASTVDVAAPPPRHLFIFDSGGDEHRIPFLKAKFGNDICVFDPGVDDRIFGSPSLISINNHGTQSPLQVPWDRGKLGASKPLFSGKRFFINCLFSFTPAAVLFPARGAASGWPWVPWSSTTYDWKHLRSCNAREGRGGNKGK